ncbi:MAG: cupredoxin domain-containing protein [Pseudomonadota bacterium]
MQKKVIFISLYIFLIAPINARAIEQYEIYIENNKFRPNILEVKAGQKFKLIIYNNDSEAEEFESFDLRREKIIPPYGKIILKLGPLDPGEYEFFGEFHPKTALGKLIVKE